MMRLRPALGVLYRVLLCFCSASCLLNGAGPLTTGHTRCAFTCERVDVARDKRFHRRFHLSELGPLFGAF